VSCLPGTYVNTTQDERRYNYNPKKYQTNDIFNTKTNINTNNYNNTKENYNSFNVSNKRPLSRVFEQSNQEKRLIEHPKARRPDQVRNPYTSQFTLG
jgi:hypothetical protein